MKQIQRLKARLATCIYRGERCPWLQDSSCSCSKRNCAGLQGIVDNPSDDSRIFLLILLLCEPNALVFEDIVGPVQYAFSIDNLVCRLTFFSDDEESPEHVGAIEFGEVKVASVKHIASQRLVREPVHRVDIMHLGIGNPIEHGYLSNDVNLSMNPDARLVLSLFFVYFLKV